MYLLKKQKDSFCPLIKCSANAGYAAISVVDFQNSPGEHAPGPSPYFNFISSYYAALGRTLNAVVKFGNLACKCDTAAPQNARMPRSAAFCLLAFSSAKCFLVLSPITSSPSGICSLIPWHETDCSAELCSSFSWSAWTNLLINFKRVKRIASYTTCTVGSLVCNTVRNSSKVGTVFQHSSSHSVHLWVLVLLPAWSWCSLVSLCYLSQDPW